MDSHQVVALARNALASSTVFRSLPEQIIDALAAKARWEAFETPNLVMKRGEVAKDLRYVVSGYLIGRSSAPDGRDTELIPFGVGQWMTWLGTFTPGPLVQNYWSSPHACFIAFPNSDVLDLTKGFASIYPPMLEEVGHRFRMALDWIWTSNLDRSELRAARHLLVLRGAGRSTVTVPQSALARTLGTSRQTLSRLLKGLEEKGLIEVGYRTISIVDMKRLRQFAQEDGPLIGDE